MERVSVRQRIEREERLVVSAQRTVQRLGRPTAQKRRRQQDERARTNVAIMQLTTASRRASERERNRLGARRFGRDRRPRRRLPEARERAPSANIGRPGAVPARPRAAPVLPSALRFNFSPSRARYRRPSPRVRSLVRTTLISEAQCVRSHASLSEIFRFFSPIRFSFFFLN